MYPRTFCLFISRHVTLSARAMLPGLNFDPAAFIKGIRPYEDFDRLVTLSVRAPEGDHVGEMLVRRQRAIVDRGASRAQLAGDVRWDRCDQ